MGAKRRRSSGGKRVFVTGRSVSDSTGGKRKRQRRYLASVAGGVAFRLASKMVSVPAAMAIPAKVL